MRDTQQEMRIANREQINKDLECIGHSQTAKNKPNKQKKQKTKTNKQKTNFVAKKGRKVVGFCQLVRRQQESNYCIKYFIYALNVRPFYRRIGIGETLSKIAMLKAKNQGAEEIFLKVRIDNHRAIQLYSKLGFKIDSVSGSRQHYREANRLRSRYYNLITQLNYQRLKEILTKRGIRLVCIQYPMRSVEPLKKMLEPHGDIIFVDNERIFKEAVKKTDYTEYFGDMFAGDFGHCTAKGNRLLAENIANAILSKCFNRYTHE